MSDEPTKPPEVWEAERLRAEAQAAEARAAAAKNLAEADLFEAQVIEQELDNQKYTLQCAKIKREYDKELCDDEHHHTYWLTGAISEASVSKCMNQLRIWARGEKDLPSDKKTPLTIWFNSPGGEVIAGMALYDYIQIVRRAGHHVTTGTLGYAASMGGILLQAGDHRVMGKEAYILIHEISAGAVGKIGEMEDTMKFMEMIQNRVVNIFAERSKLSKAKLKSGMKRKDWWLDSDESLKNGLVDEVL